MPKPMPEFHRELLLAVPEARRALAFKFGRERAEEAIQEAVTRALANSAKFIAGTSMKAWLIVIARNWILSKARLKSALVVSLDDNHPLPAISNLDARIELREALEAMATLNADWSEACLLFAQGWTLSELALRFGVPEGTIKSRVWRVRNFLLTGEVYESKNA